MKSIFFYLFFICSVFKLFSQNIVPNGNFETVVFCPNNFNQVWAATSWSPSTNNHNPTYGTEYMNSCGLSNFGVPSNHFGSQVAHSGVGYMASVTLAPTVGLNYRENIYAKLTSTMVVGATYSISMFVSHTDNSENASNKIGIKFSKGQDFPINNIAHLYSSTIITNKSNWTQISGTFVADSVYQYICVGNFFDDANTSKIVSCPPCSYNLYGYYIDDIEVINVTPTTSSSFTTTSLSICEYETINFNNTSVNALTYDWNFGDGATSTVQHPSHTYILNGVYSVSLTAYNGTLTSQSVKTITVNPKPDLLPATASYTICEKESVTLSVNGATTYSWSPNRGLSVTNQASVTANPLSTINYTVVGANIFGCKDTSHIDVIVKSLPTLAINANTLVCIGDTVSLLATTNASAILWNNGSASTSTTVTPISNAFFTSTVTENGCSVKDSIFINVLTGVNADFVRSEYDSCKGSVVFTCLNNSSLNQWLINGSLFVNSCSVTYNYSTSGVYDVRLITNPNTNCADTMTKPFVFNYLSTTDLILANVFTPNNDNVNDIIDFSKYAVCGDLEFEIFDRWGLSILKSMEKKQSYWDGRTTSGEMVNDGVYYYILTIDENKYKGTISLFR